MVSNGALKEERK